MTSCTADRKTILANVEAHQVFVQFAQSAAARRVLVGRYILMPDHMHLFAAFGAESPSLSFWMQALKRTFARHWTDRGTQRPHWQKGYFDHLLRSAESYDEKWRYVWQNPVRAGFVQRADDWEFQGEIHKLSVTLA